jgi:hypothetical protein
MWFYPLPGIAIIAGWIFILATSKPRSLLIALAVFVVGSAAFFIRARVLREWPFADSKQ